MEFRTVVRRALKPAVFLAAAVPALLLLFDFATDRLGAEPIEEITHRTGLTGLTLLVIGLGVTPLRTLSGWNAVIGVRRMLGLFAFFYVSLHFLTYVVLDQFFALEFIIEDIAERPYITVGFTSFVLLIPLALTSTKGAIRRLGKRWVQLHRLVYLAAIGGVVHFLWLVKADTRRPIIYGVAVATLLAARLVPRIRRKRAKRAMAA